MNRRRFLQLSSAGVGLGGTMLGLAACATPGRARLRQSTSSIHFKGLPIEQACERVAALGFEAIDIWCAYDSCPHLDDVAQRLGGRGLREVLGKHRLELFAFSTYVGGYAKYAKVLGDAGGGVAVQGSAGPCAPADLVPRMRTFFEELKPLADLAGQHHSRLAIENHGHALLDGPDSFKAFVDLNPYPNVGVALAPYHIQALGASVPETIRIAGSQLLFFYAWQNAPGTHQLPGHGPADFAPWVRALIEVKYAGYLNAFMHGHLEPVEMAEALSRSRTYLKTLT